MTSEQNQEATTSPNDVVTDQHPLDSNYPSASLALANSDLVFDGSSAEVSSGESFQFGIKSMALIVMFPAMLFAVIAYLGALIGLSIGFAVSFVALSVVLLIGVFKHATASPQGVRQLNGWTLLLSFACVVLFFSMAFAGGGKAAFYFLSNVSLGQRYASELGFSYEVERHMKSSNPFGGEFRTIRITSIVPGGEFERAGFFEDDIIFNFSYEEIFKEFEKRRGEEIGIVVCSQVSKSLVADLDQETQREVTLQIPD